MEHEMLACPITYFFCNLRFLCRSCCTAHAFNRFIMVIICYVECHLASWDIVIQQRGHFKWNEIADGQI